MNIAGDNHQEIIEVVSHAAGQLAERVELLRFRELPLDLHQPVNWASLRSEISRVILA